MENEKKRKKNKRKKNKNNKAADTASVSAGESVASDLNLANGNDQNHQSHVSESSDAIEDSQKVDVEYQDNIVQVAALQEKIKQLQMEKDVYMQKEDDLQMRIFQLEGEKDSWLQKEAGFQERINQLIAGTATLSSRGVGLEEKISVMERDRDSWVQKEGATKETTERVYSDNLRLQEKVLELRKLNDRLVQENQHLTVQIHNSEKNSSSAQLLTDRIRLVAETEVLKSELEASRDLAEKLFSQNSELVEKVNELYLELNQRSVISEPMVGSAEKIDASVHTPSAPILIESLENVTLNSEKEHSSYQPDEVTQSSPEIKEVLQISLQENQVNKDLESAHVEEIIEVPISDAPLIGAPFRLFSFVARYVSGADLVNSTTR